MAGVTEFKDFKRSQILKHITVSERNYHTLKSLGSARYSFNDVVTEILKKLQQAQSLETTGQIAASATKWVRSDG